MIYYWLSVTAVSLICVAIVCAYHFLLKRTSPIFLIFLLKAGVIWGCTLFPLWSVNALFRHFHSTLIGIERGGAIALILILSFSAHLILLAISEKKSDHQK